MLGLAGCSAANPAFDEKSAVGSDDGDAPTDGGTDPRPTTAGTSAGTATTTTTTDPSGADTSVLDTSPEDTGVISTTTNGTGNDDVPPQCDSVRAQLLPVSADTYLTSLDTCLPTCADQNFGGAHEGLVISAGGTSVMLLRFDELPVGIVLEASLELTVDVLNPPGPFAAASASVFADSCGWAEGEGPYANTKSAVGTATYNACAAPDTSWSLGAWDQEVGTTLGTTAITDMGSDLSLTIPLDPVETEQWIGPGFGSLVLTSEGITPFLVRSRDGGLPPTLTIEYCLP